LLKKLNGHAKSNGKRLNSHANGKLANGTNGSLANGHDRTAA
jgi:hypothetical protein